MDRFQERIESNPVHADLRSLKDFIAGLSDEVAAQIDETVPGLRQRVSAVVAYTQGVLATADPYLVPPSTLVSLQSTAAQANATASALAATPANAPTLDQQLDDLLIPAIALGALNPVTAKTAKAVGEVLGSSAAARAADLEAQARLFESQLRDLEVQRDQQVTALSDSIEQKRVEFEGVADTITQTFAAQQAEVSTQLTAFAQQFSVAEASRNGQFGETVTAIRATSDKLSSDLEKQHAELITTQTEAGDAALARVEAVNTKVNELYQAVAQTGTAGAYAEDAVEQRDIANKWRLTAVGSASVAVVVALAAMLHYWNATQTSAADVTSKAAVVFGLGLIAAYAARQSGQHRHREERSKRLQLQLVSFEPFVKQLDPEDQNKARSEFVGRLFDGEGDHPMPATTATDPHDFGGVGPEAAKALSALVAAIAARK